MSNVLPVGAADFAGYARKPARAQAASPGFSGGAQFSGKPQGSHANFELISGALTCCALPFMLAGALTIGGLVFAARKAFRGVSQLKLPHTA